MALATPSPTPSPQQPKLTKRMWKAPGSIINWFWLVISLLVYASLYIWYLYGLKLQPYPYPTYDPFRLFGIVAFVLVLAVAAYSLRRRFVRTLPGKVQSWLWLHTWFGIAALLITFLHENYVNILSTGGYDFSLSRLLGAAGGMLALFSLLFLVISGIIGRLLDVWQARVIAIEASTNGVGIIQSVQQRLHETDLTIERLRAGKSALFKHACAEALRGKALNASVAATLPVQEQQDFLRACDISTKRAQLTRSLKRQERARFIIQAWRYVHIPLACLALVIICFHSLVELAKLVLQLLLHKP